MTIRLIESQLRRCKCNLDYFFIIGIIFYHSAFVQEISIPKTPEGKASEDKEIKIVGTSPNQASKKNVNKEVGVIEELTVGIDNGLATPINIPGPRNELADCKKDDDGQKISCPDGIYIKSSSVVNSLRDSTIKKDIDSSNDKKIRIPTSVSGQ